ncbi:MAG: DMT family transporter [Candidatus Magasanikbacteria bacterium]|nr:DMT family transporter [Candidatus Magasanikbacteria bacterium]
MWFLLSVIGYFFLAIAFVMDKFILTKSVGKPIIYTFYSTIFLLPVFLLVPFGLKVPQGIDLFIALFSSFSFGFGLWTLFVAVKSGEASHIDPFNGAMITLATYVGSSFFLGETLESAQIAGVVILVFACLLLSFEKSQKHHGFHIGFLWAIISGICFAASLVAAKYLFGHYSFVETIVWTRASVGFFGILLLASKTVRHSLLTAKKKKLKTYGKKHALSIVITAKVLSVVAILLINYAISIGSVTLVNALGGLQYVYMFIIIYLCTKFLPKIFKEYFTKRELVVETIAIALVALGSVFFVL